MWGTAAHTRLDCPSMDEWSERQGSAGLGDHLDFVLRLQSDTANLELVADPSIFQHDQIYPTTPNLTSSIDCTSFKGGPPSSCRSSTPNHDPIDPEE